MILSQGAVMKELQKRMTIPVKSFSFIFCSLLKMFFTTFYFMFLVKWKQSKEEYMNTSAKDNLCMLTNSKRVPFKVKKYFSLLFFIHSHKVI